MAGKTKSRQNGFAKELKKNRTLFIMLLPAIVLTVIFAYIPMGGVIVAFKNYKYGLGILGSPFVGLKNFSYFFSSGVAWTLTKNTLFYNLLFMAAGTVFKIIIALFIFEMYGKYYKRVLQSVMILPYFLSWVVIGGLAYNMLNYEFGTINTLLSAIGLGKLDVYNNAGAWKYILTSITLWQGTGYGMIFYLAALTGINPELYESAYLDGAGLLQRIWYITIPLILPTTIILVLLSLGGILRGNLDMFYQLVGTNANLFDATDVIDTYVFRSLTQLKDFTITSAAGLYQQAIGCVLVLSVNAVVKKLDPDSAIF